MSAIRYATDEERKAARRQTYRDAHAKRRDDYLRLCRVFDQTPVGDADWKAHYRELRNVKPSAAEVANADLLVTTTCPMQRWWLRRHTLNEIRQLAAGLYGDTKETTAGTRTHSDGGARVPARRQCR